MPEDRVIVGSTPIARLRTINRPAGRGSEVLEGPNLELELLAGGVAFDQASHASSHRREQFVHPAGGSPVSPCSCRDLTPHAWARVVCYQSGMDDPNRRSTAVGWFLVALAAVIFALTAGRLDDTRLVPLLVAAAAFLTGLTIVHAGMTRR